MSPPKFITHPTISGNPNPAVPLAAILHFSADRFLQTTVEVFDGEREWKITFDESHKPEEGLPIIGMRADRFHRFRVTIRDDAGSLAHAPDVLEFKTPPLPSGLRNFPPLETTVSKPELMEPGVTLMNVRRRIPKRRFLIGEKQREFFTGWSLLLALDAEGEVVWYYQSDERLAGFNRLKNGNLFFLTTGSQAKEIDMLGNLVSHWYAAKRPQGPIEGAIPVDVHTIHHQPHELPWGNFLAMTAFPKEIENFYTSESDPDAPRRNAFVMGDKIVEFSRDGSTAWEWNSFDYLDPYRIGYETIHPYWHVRGFPHHMDWTHGNGAFYSDEDDTLLLCMRLQDAVIKIDRSTGDIRWILGNHHGWSGRLKAKLLKPRGNVRWPYRMHNPEITPQGTILIWDNSTIQARPFDGKAWVPPHRVHSRAVEYAVDEKKMTVSQVWSSEDPAGVDRFCCQAMGDVQWLAQKGNVLTFYGTCAADRNDMSYDIKDNRHVSEFPMTTRVREFTHSTPPRMVFEVILADPDGLISWECFGGNRVPSLYPMGIVDRASTID